MIGEWITAAKAAGVADPEAMRADYLAAYAEGSQIDEAYIFRFVSILGERYTHGHVFDFHQQLIARRPSDLPLPPPAARGSMVREAASGFLTLPGPRS